MNIAKNELLWRQHWIPWKFSSQFYKRSVSKSTFTRNDYEKHVEQGASMFIQVKTNDLFSWHCFINYWKLTRRKFPYKTKCRSKFQAVFILNTFLFNKSLGRLGCSVTLSFASTFEIWTQGFYFSRSPIVLLWIAES